MYRSKIAGMAGKAGDFYVPVNPNWHLSLGSEVAVVWAQRSEGIAASSPPPDLLWHFCEVQWGCSQPAEDCGTQNAWGYPNLKSANKLIYQLAYGKINRKWIALTGNTWITRSLGKCGIVCMEDVIHEDLFCWKIFQRSKQLPVTLQIIFSTRWNEEKDHPSSWRWRCSQKINRLIERIY